MINQKFVLTLEGYGYELKNTIRELGVRTIVDPRNTALVSDLDFVYNECVAQVVLALTPDLPAFFNNLTVIPDFKYFEHIAILHDPNRFRHLCHAVRVFAVGLVTIINRYIGIELNADYLLESVAPDFIIINRIYP